MLKGAVTAIAELWMYVCTIVCGGVLMLIAWIQRGIQSRGDHQSKPPVALYALTNLSSHRSNGVGGQLLEVTHTGTS